MSKLLSPILLFIIATASLVACSSSAQQPTPVTAASVAPEADPYAEIENQIYSMNYKEAVELADAKVNAEGPNARNLTLRGIAYAKLNKPYPALMDLIEASKIDRNVDTLVNAGIALRMFGHCDRATDAFRQALSLSPDNPEILMDLTSSYLCLQDIDMANETIQKSFANFPKDAVAYTNVAILKHQTAEYEDSRKAAERAVEIDPNYRPAYQVLNLACLKLNDDVCAQNAKDKANELNGLRFRSKRAPRKK